MKITYFGHSCLHVEQDGKKIIIDPFLTGNPQSQTDPQEIQADAIVLTHGHDDHLGNSIDIAKKNNCPIIAVFELAMYCRQQGAEVHPMNIGGSHTFDGFKVKLTPAFHSTSIHVNGQYLYAGQPAGILLTMGDHTLYHAGDTALFSDMKMLGELYRIDVAALPIGDNFTMGPEEALIAANWIKAKHVIPTHYNTFPVIQQDSENFTKRLAEYGIKGYALKSRESIEI